MTKWKSISEVRINKLKYFSEVYQSWYRDNVVYCVAMTHERANTAKRSIWLSALAATIRKVSTLINMPMMAHGIGQAKQ